MSISSGIINTFLDGSYELSIYTSKMLFPLSAKIVDLIPGRNIMTLELNSSEDGIDKLFYDNKVCIDIKSEKKEKDLCSRFLTLANVPVQLFKLGAFHYQLNCRMPDDVFFKEKRGTLRTPFILGMSAEVVIEVYPHILSVSGLVRDISSGGCLVEIDIAESIALDYEQEFPVVLIKFPNGDTFSSKGKVRHIRPLGTNGTALAGIQFFKLTEAQNEELIYIVGEAEREAAFRIGLTGMLTDQSKLFVPSNRIKSNMPNRIISFENNRINFSMNTSVIDIVHRLQIGLMYLKTRNHFSQEIFYDCADTVLYLIKLDPNKFLYALTGIDDEPEWARHAVQVAGRLGCMLVKRDPHNPSVRETILAALLHTMGKPLLIGPNLPSLKMKMDISHKRILLEHVVTLLERTKLVEWQPGPVCSELIENANELIDGRGYPKGKAAGSLSDTVKLMSIIKVVNTLMHGRNGKPPLSAIDAYRQIHDNESYDKALLIEYIQHNGIYPTGTLVKYSGGFIAWVLDIDEKGLPIDVFVVKNINYPDSNLRVRVAKSDLVQLGKIHGNVFPADYGIIFGAISD